MRATPALLLAVGVCLAGAAAASGESPIYTYAGTGVASTTGDGGPAVSATLNQPAGLEIAADGSLLVAETGGNVIRRITPAGTIQTLAGDGSSTHSGDGGPATAAGIYAPRDVALSPDKSVLYVLETLGATVRRIDLVSGVITTVVGTGTPGATGDYGPAGSATLGVAGPPTPLSPQGIGIAANGDLYIADTANNKVRMVTAGANHLIDASDIITTFAGTGTVGHGGDQGAAVLATLFRPADVLPMADGTVIIADGYQGSNDAQLLRSVGADGVIRYYSKFGAGASGVVPAGDGGSVSAATINVEGLLAADGSGGLIAAENVRNRVRRVEVSGAVTRVSTLAGSGYGPGAGGACQLTDLCGDYGPAVNAPLNAPIGVAGSPTGRLYISEGNRIRVRVYAPGAGGPQGPPGPAGPGGVPGPQGPDGAAGASGAMGAGGPAGPTGPSGPQGTGGARGADGPNGHPGRTGATGPNGPNGSGGADGANGTPGADGERGADGAKGQAGDPFAGVGGVPLVVALPAARVVRRTGRRIVLRLYVSTGTTIAGRVVTDGHAITSRRTFLRAGLKQLDLGRLAPGRYRIVVEARSGSRSSSDRATLFVR